MNGLTGFIIGFILCYLFGFIPGILLTLVIITVVNDCNKKKIKDLYVPKIK